MAGQRTGVGVTAEQLGVDGPRGAVFSDVSVRAEPGSLLALRGPSGSGRTALLLTLTGRMRPTTGTAEVGGQSLPRRAAAVRRFAALGPVPGITDPEPSLSVAETLRERALLLHRFGGSLPPLRQRRGRNGDAPAERRAEALATAGLDLRDLPSGPRTRIRELGRPQEFRLGVALALLGRPRLLAVDDVGLKLDAAEEARMWTLLSEVAATGVTVVAVGDPPPSSTGDGITLVTIGAGRDA
ncbi:ATP-binding cassette domain-containing protein [Streptomyces sp. TR06-5]|uniref:ATP-binding cassette domain-containing protein n=1 Tax=unclassified Streptomyces TaxID=2593676 RepID=UPI00399FAE15